MNLIMKKFFLLATTAAMLILSSCKKDNVDKPNPNPEPDPDPNPSAKVLKKMTKTEDGATTVYTLTYNNNKKLESIIANNNLEKTLFTYDAAGNLAQVEQSDEEFHNIYTYAYENGFPKSATFKSWMRRTGEPDELIEDDLLTYTVENNQVKKINLVMQLAENAEVEFDMHYTNGNLTKVTADAPFNYTAEFTFGTKKPVLPAVSKWVLDHAGFSLQYAAKNEVLSASFDFPNDNFDRTITTQYTYDANGYVLTSTDGTATMKFDYE
jgi:YD repeat-containing protein